MGYDGVEDGELGGESRRTFMRHLLNDLRALERLIDEGLIEEQVRRIGAEQEMFLVDRKFRPAPVAMELLQSLNDRHFTTELGLFNLEANLEPFDFGGDCLRRMEDQLNRLLARVRECGAGLATEIVLCGILPTLRKSDLHLGNMTPLPRYRALNRALTRLRDGSYEFFIEGMDELIVKHDSVMLEACNTSFQVHFQVGAREFPHLYNIAQAATAPVLAVACNSPLLFGRQLWRETRIALFQQAVDTRSTGHHLRERSSRVSFGNDWLRNSVLELFQEDIARFRALVAVESTEDAMAVLDAGGVPELSALRLHNGTVYRWNRGCYGISGGKPHLRIENRVLPSGPTVVDQVANAAFWFGLISYLAHEYDDITKVMEFEHAKMNFLSAARHGLESQLTWTDGEVMPAAELVLERLLPMAREGLEYRELNPDDATRYLDVVEERVRAKASGASWMIRSLASMGGRGSQGEGLNALTAGMLTRQKDGLPVAHWDLCRLEEGGEWHRNVTIVEQCMSSDVFTVHADDSLDLVASLMGWQRIRHVPVEDAAGHLIGLVTYRSLLRLMARGEHLRDGGYPAVSDVMNAEPISVSPETTTLEAIELMRKNGVGCLPVVKDGRLVGMITERDFMNVARELLRKQIDG